MNIPIKKKAYITVDLFTLVAGARLELRPPLADMRPTSEWNEKKAYKTVDLFTLVAGARLELRPPLADMRPTSEWNKKRPIKL
ncbi:MAG: hypothetical protein JNL95_05530 [Chitinophagales bacterium]|nr:hypothetical protein [Chitinophagales bacterium]